VARQRQAEYFAQKGSRHWELLQAERETQRAKLRKEAAAAAARAAKAAKSAGGAVRKKGAAGPSAPRKSITRPKGGQDGSRFSTKPVSTKLASMQHRCAARHAAARWQCQQPAPRRCQC
jgi:hypothetical protein